MAIKDGNEYRARIDELQPEIWVGGKKTDGKCSEHPAFRGIIRSQAELYDFQVRNPDCMAYVSPESGEMTGLSYMAPQSRNDLLKRKAMMEAWASIHGGWIGRSPDYMNTAVMVLAGAADWFGDCQYGFPEHARHFYEHCSQNDITLSHTFVFPQSNRSSSYMNQVNHRREAARVTAVTSKGLTINGACMLATQGGITDEILVFPGPCPKEPAEENPLAYAFAVPSNWPGVKFICRESFDYGKSVFDHPLGSRYEEMDAIVLFDEAHIPWERVFFYGDSRTANSFFAISNFYAHVSHQVVIRYIAKTEFLLGLAESIVKSIGTGEYLNVQEKVAEIVMLLEALKGLLLSAEEGAEQDVWGLTVPDPNPLIAACAIFHRAYPKMIGNLQLLCGSGVVAIPEEAAWDSPLGERLDAVMKGANLGGKDKTALFRLAWDASMSAFASRQLQYERFFFGDPLRYAGRLYLGYDKEERTERIRQFLGITALEC